MPLTTTNSDKKSAKGLFARFTLCALSLTAAILCSLAQPLRAAAEPYELTGISEEDILKNIDLRKAPDSSTHLFLWWIDHDGKKVRDLNYEAVDVLQGGVAAAVRKGQYNSVLIGISGEQISKDDFSALGTYSEGLVAAETQFNWGFVDRSGEYVIRPQFISVDDFSEGLAPACKEKLYGYINRLGDFVIQPKFQKALSFHENVAAAKMQDKWGYINKDGSFVIQPRYDQAGKFSDERALVQVGTKWGVIDLNGKYIVSPKFEDAGFFREGLCPVKDGDHWGFIDRQGVMVIPAKLDRAFSFHEGNASVRVGNKFGFIDHDNRFVIPLNYDLALPFAEGVAVVGEINWNHPSARMFLLKKHLEKMVWRADTKKESLTSFYIPVDEADAVRELLNTLPPEAVSDMKTIGLSEMTSYQYLLGNELRTRWGLLKASPLCKYYGEKGVKQPDAMTLAVLVALWQDLHKSK